MLIAARRLAIEGDSASFHRDCHTQRVPREDFFRIVFWGRRNRPLLPAVFANPIDLEPVMQRLEVILTNNLILDALQFRRDEFDGLVALGANNVVMMRMVVAVLKSREAVAEHDLAGNP